MFKEILIGLLAVISILYFIKLFRESRFNFLLRNKQKQMRVINTNVNFRRGTLVKALVPAMTIALVLLVNPGVEYNKFSNTNPNVKIAEINSKSDIMSIYKDFQENMNNDGLFGRGVILEVEKETEALPEMTLDNSESMPTEKADDYSKTNLQVVGVDEIDNVKTDGKFIYSISDGKVVITQAYPAEELSVYKSIKYNLEEECVEENCYSEYPSGMYVDEDYLVVVVNKNTRVNWKYYEEKKENEDDSARNMIMPYWYGSSDTAVYVYDKEDNFELVSTFELSGNMIGTRKIGDNLFIITIEYVNYQAMEEDENLDVLPTYNIDGEEFTCGYEDLIYIEGTDPHGFTNIYGIDLDKSDVDLETILGSSSHNIYVSSSNIYTIDHRYHFFGRLEGLITDASENEELTTISKFSLNDHEVELTATGEVKGYPLNQFSMDEYKNNFRITTTTGWGENVLNRLYILDEDLTEISVVGETKEDKIGKPEERLQSTRFVGDIVYLVTFERTDPFYVFDLSDPEEPKKLGELEITGFSSYIQQIDKNHVLGIGFEADDDGRTTGLKLSVYEIDYDTVDELGLIKVEEIHKEVIGNGEGSWNWASVTYNHKDLMFNLNKGILGFPLSQTITDGKLWRHQSGFLLYDFSLEDGFKQIGYATHGVEDYNDYVYKGLYLEHNLYTISNHKIAVSPLDDVENFIKIIELVE
ncbi:beta-propeller domain-containing protein [Mycoplasmatota bacterium zrk1]